MVPSQCPASCDDNASVTGTRHKLPTSMEITRSTDNAVGMLQSLERLKPRNFGGWKQNVNTAILGFGLDFCPVVQNGFAPTNFSRMRHCEMVCLISWES